MNPLQEEVEEAEGDRQPQDLRRKVGRIERRECCRTMAFARHFGMGVCSVVRAASVPHQLRRR